MPAIPQVPERMRREGTVVPFLRGLSQLRGIGYAGRFSASQWRRMQPPSPVNPAYYASTVHAERDGVRIETTVEVTDEDLLVCSKPGELRQLAAALYHEADTEIALYLLRRGLEA